jgi:aminoglycoside/choline kinase family phosphotransferase
VEVQGPKLTREHVDERWLTDVLRAGGAIRDARVTGFAAQEVGVGMLGESVRFELSYDRVKEGAPASVVGKFASPDPVSRRTGMDYGLYQREVDFYREVAETVAIRVPHCFFAEIDAESGAFALVLEDLSPARSGNQLVGCSVEDAERAMVQAAALHGPRWNDPEIAGRHGVVGSENASALIETMPACLAEFHRRYDDMLEPHYMHFCDRYVAACGGFIARRYDRLSLVHLDFRLDNMLFDAGGGRYPLAVVDWQSVMAGPPSLDVAYFIGLCLPAELRRRHERELLLRYLDELKRYGVTDYDYDALYADYRVTLLQGVQTAIFASAGTKRTDRGDQMFLAMARSGIDQAIDAESLAAI